MGDAHAEDVAMIAKLTGHEPIYDSTPDKQQCLRIGDLEIVATGFALWSDPRVWDHGDGMISITWGGQTVRLYQQPDRSWTHECLPDLLAGKARWVI